MYSNLRIAVDGLSASGKGTLAKMLANVFSLPYMDTGKIYRILAYDMIERGIDASDVDSILSASVDTNFSCAISDVHKTEVVAGFASKVAAIPEVRKFLLSVQRDFAVGGAVLDGRDIGSAVLPDADYKFYVIADIKVRAARRYNDIKNMGYDIDYDELLQLLFERDNRDLNRECAPLIIADGAFIIDTSRLSMQEMLDVAVASIKRDC